MAVGDIKAILSRSLGAGEVKDVLKASPLHQLTRTQVHDGDLFNTFQPGLWQHLRETFHTQVKLELLKGDPLKETDTPSAHIHKSLKIWRTELGDNPEKDALQRAMFRQSWINELRQ